MKVVSLKKEADEFKTEQQAVEAKAAKESKKKKKAKGEESGEVKNSKQLE